MEAIDTLMPYTTLNIQLGKKSVVGEKLKSSMVGEIVHGWGK